MPKYGKAAGKSVERAMRKEKKGHAEIGQGRKRRQSDEPQASHRDWALRSAKEGREGSEEEIELSRGEQFLADRASIERICGATVSGSMRLFSFLKWLFTCKLRRS